MQCRWSLNSIFLFSFFFVGSFHLNFCMDMKTNWIEKKKQKHNLTWLGLRSANKANFSWSACCRVLRGIYALVPNPYYAQLTLLGAPVLSFLFSNNTKHHRLGTQFSIHSTGSYEKFIEISERNLCHTSSFQSTFLINVLVFRFSFS